MKKFMNSMPNVLFLTHLYTIPRNTRQAMLLTPVILCSMKFM
jgi:hypothetical protein